MKILTGFSNCSNRCKTLFFGLFFLLFSGLAKAQNSDILVGYPPDYEFGLPSDTVESENALDPADYPNPKGVLYKSLIIPGWGQIVNKQIWKVPIIYGLFGGLGWYSVYLTKRYHDYRAAYYNATSEEDDFRFGPTPKYIPETASSQALRDTRNQLRNRRDFVYIAFVLAYGLNAVDAYVFAHMRTFDVSEDLSVRAQVKPSLLTHNRVPGITISFGIFNRSKTE